VVPTRRISLLAVLACASTALLPATAAPPPAAGARAPACAAVVAGETPSAGLSRALVERSIDLGTSFMLANQRPAGNFYYQYDWRTRTDREEYSPARQAGAAWGLALLYRAGAGRRVEAALERALGFFARHSRRTIGGGRYLVYPGSDTGSLGAVALAALTHIDYLRAAPRPRPDLQRALRGYLQFIVRARLPAGRFHARYRHDDGTPLGDPSPYFDGESLLALVLAAKYLGRVDLVPVALTEATAAHRLNVEQPLAQQRDPAITKGYYQWSSMAYYELAHSGWRGAARYGDWLIALTDWMVDVHQPLRRRRNTAYAYEGIVPAYALAHERSDRAHTAKLGCVIERGLARLISWQVGSPSADRTIRAHPTRDVRAIGGVQNHARRPALRIDVTQHQLHALLLARRHYPLR